MTGIKNVKKRAGACEVEAAEPSQWQRERVTRQQRLYRAKLAPASAELVNQRPDDARWYCLIVVDGSELSVDSRLSDAGVEALVPREKRSILRKQKKGEPGKLIEVERACFEGYVFVRILPSPLAFMRLREVKGVLEFLRAGERYHVVRSRDLGFYRGAFTGLNTERMKSDKTIGDGTKVLVKFGPFSGVEGVVLQVSKPASRDPVARIWSALYGKEIKNVPLAHLERL
jgi:transcriptional antiterminator NusG